MVGHTDSYQDKPRRSRGLKTLTNDWGTPVKEFEETPAREENLGVTSLYILLQNQKSAQDCLASVCLHNIHKQSDRSHHLL